MSCDFLSEVKVILHDAFENPSLCYFQNESSVFVGSLSKKTQFCMWSLVKRLEIVLDQRL